MLIKKVDNKIIRINEYVIMLIYVRNIFDDLIKTIYFIIKVYIINDFKINIFIDIDIMTLKEIFMNLNVKVFILTKC